VGSNNRLPGLDGLRGIAALAVFLGHANALPQNAAYGLAVDLFFILSGLVIAQAYERRLDAGGWFVAFAKTRLIRLYPSYIVGTAIGGCFVAAAILWGHSPPYTAAEFIPAALAAIFLLPAPARTLYLLNGPAWTLFFELISNAAYAILRPWRRTSLLVWWVAISGVVLAVVTIKNGSSSMGWLWTGLQLIGGLARVSFGFSAGLLLHHLLRQGRIKAVPLGLPIVFVVTATILVLGRPPGRWTSAYDIVATVVVLPLLVAAAARSEVPSWMDTRFLFFAGAVSYPLYVVHAPLLQWTDIISDRLGMSEGMELLCALPAIFLVAVVVTYFVDTPLRAALTRRLLSRQDRRVSADEPMPALAILR
jgi:peptidoglycan/LPS O-acetylase OafA/YrhL